MKLVVEFEIPALTVIDVVEVEEELQKLVSDIILAVDTRARTHRNCTLVGAKIIHVLANVSLADLK